MLYPSPLDPPLLSSCAWPGQSSLFWLFTKIRDGVGFRGGRRDFARQFEPRAAQRGTESTEGRKRIQAAIQRARREKAMLAERCYASGSNPQCSRALAWTLFRRDHSKTSAITEFREEPLL